MSVQQGLDYVATWNSSMLLSDDLKEVISAQKQKRKPSFSKLFAEHLVATEERKIERYIRGLRIDIMELVSTRKLVTFWEKEEKQVKENTIRGDGAVVEKEDFSDWMSEFNGLCDPYSGDMEDS
ncbi:delta(3,5)-delta(2,4)-dienoyl-CoA isomerase, mitochondrial [Tanacetum coccineum]